MTVGSSLLEVEGLRVSYRVDRGPRRPAVNGVGFSVCPGEIVALLGASGSGKTTIVRAILGLLPAPPRAVVEGAVVVEGRELVGDARRRRQMLGVRVGHVPQDPLASLNPVHRVGRQVEEVLHIHRLGSPGSRTAAAAAALERAGLEPAADFVRRYPHELSGGQRQRAIIAGALVASPRLLIADEPTSALDVTVQRRVLDLLVSVVREQGTGLLLITHDLGVAAERADRILVLDGGAIVEEGPAASVAAGPRSEAARSLFAASPSLHALLPPPREPGGGTLVAARGVSKRFRSGGRDITAVDRISFEVREGESVGVVGESGSGKSTLARLLLGLAGADGGEIQVGGELLRGHVSARQLRRVARLAQPVFQDPASSFDPRSRIGQAIGEPLRGFGVGNHSTRRERIREVARLVHLPSELLDRKPHELSGGQLQRAAIARALAAQPKLLVCDEPVSSLDVVVQARVLELLRRLRDEHGVAVVLISHDLAVVRRNCDRIAVMRGGRIVETGATDQIFESPRHSYTRELLAAIPDPVARWGGEPAAPNPGPRRLEGAGGATEDGSASALAAPGRVRERPPSRLPGGE